MNPPPIGWRIVARRAARVSPAIEIKPGYETFWAHIPHSSIRPSVYAPRLRRCLVNSLYAVYEHAAEGFAERLPCCGAAPHH